MDEMIKITMTVVLLVISWKDIRTMTIPNRYLALLVVPLLLSLFFEPQLLLSDRMLGGICVSLPMRWMIRAVPGSFGGADVKLIGLGGLFLGWRATLVAMFLAILTGGCFGICLLLGKRIRPGGHFAFGPFLALGIEAAMLSGTRLFDWYATFFIS